MPAINVPQPEFMEDEEISIFADAVGKFYQQHAPEKRVLKWREDGQVEREFWNEAGEAGLLGVSVPEEYGGHGGDFRRHVVIDQQAKHGVEGFAASLHNTVILPYLVRHGTEEQKKKYLPKLVTGELVSAIAMTEPGVGSDLQSITTTALKDVNGYRINGEKTYISNGQTADFIIVVAKTDPNERAKGISLMLLETEAPKASSAARSSTRSGWTRRIPPNCSSTMSSCRRRTCSAARRQGLLPANGGAAAGTADHRNGCDDRDREGARGRDGVRQEPQGVRPDDLGFQNTQFVLADLNARGTAARVFVNDCIAKHLKGELDVPTACMAKYMVTELQGEVVDKCLQFHGGAGFINDYPIARMYRDSRITRIFGGSNEVMKMVIARSM